MFHVLIIDDHLDQRELVRFLLNKHQTDWLITEAENGKNALDIFLNNPIDFVITDVKMPFITGIEFAEAVRKKNTTIPILFISGYDQFDFVKKALTLQAVNYILKPINPVEFNEQLDNLTQLLHERQQATTKEKWIERMVKKEALTKLLHGVPLKALEQNEQVQVAPTLATITFLMIFDLVKNNDQQMTQMNLLLEAFTDKPVIQVSPNRFVLFSDALSEIDALYKKEQIQNAFTKRKEKVSSFISQPMGANQTLYQVYTDLSQNITQTFYNTTDQPNKTIILPTRTPLTELNFVQQVSKLIQKNQYDQVEQLLQTTFRDYQAAAAESPTIVKFFFANIYKHILNSANIDLQQWQPMIKQLLETPQFNSVSDSFNRLFSYLKQRETLIDSDSNDYIREIKEYVFNYYTDELSLETIAREINITPKYLSELFIKDEGIGISKFIKEVRLNKAKELLTTSNKRIIDISKQTGFNNHSYFIKIFRETVGMTPDSYRKSKKR